MSFGKATSKKSIIISSQLWSPHFTSLEGSGLWGLFAELSKCATHFSFGAFRRVSVRHRMVVQLPAEAVIRYVQQFLPFTGRIQRREFETLPRRCMCGNRSTIFASVPNSNSDSTR
jgi:hypothetical protein